MTRTHWILVAVVLFFVLVGVSQRNGNQKTVPALQPLRNREASLIEATGLPEFASEHNARPVSTPNQDFARELQPITDLLIEKPGAPPKTGQAIDALGALIAKHPDRPDLRVLRASVSLVHGGKNYQDTLADIDAALSAEPKLVATGMYKKPTVLALRAKVDVLRGDFKGALDDLAAAVTADPDAYSEVFRSGGVKPEEDTDPTSLNKADYDALVSSFPNDFRSYMFRGLFHLFFATFGEKAFPLAIADLRRATEIDPSSALARCFLGSAVYMMAYRTEAAWRDLSDDTGAPGGYRNQMRNAALPHFQRAAELDPKLVGAHANLAAVQTSLKRYPEAIASYSRVLELQPNNASVFNDRGLAKAEIRDDFGAFSDYSEAIRLATKGDGTLGSLSTTYQNRAKASLRIQRPDDAIADYGRAIATTLKSQIFMIQLPQIREMYPELRNILDKDLLEGLRQKYFPNMNRDVFTKHYAELTKRWDEFVLAGLYVERADVVLRSGNYRKAAEEYVRASKVWTHALDDRWRVLATDANTVWAIDCATVELPAASTTKLWTKTTAKFGHYTQTNYQFDCQGRRLKALTSMVYDRQGNMLQSHPEAEWQSIGPETIGEQLYAGACKQ